MKNPPPSSISLPLVVLAVLADASTDVDSTISASFTSSSVCSAGLSAASPVVMNSGDIFVAAAVAAAADNPSSPDCVRPNNGNGDDDASANTGTCLETAEAPLIAAAGWAGDDGTVNALQDVAIMVATAAAADRIVDFDIFRVLLSIKKDNTQLTSEVRYRSRFLSGLAVPVRRDILYVVYVLSNRESTTEIPVR